MDLIYFYQPDVDILHVVWNVDPLALTCQWQEMFYMNQLDLSPFLVVKLGI